MDDITELRRLPSPAPRPQSLAFDGMKLWMGSIATRRICAIDPATWFAHDEVVAPGNPWGIAVVGDELRVVCGEGDDDHRFVRRYIPGHGFKSEGSFPCPDDAGSQLGWDGDRLYLSQWYNKRILSLDEHGHAGSTIDVPHQICGQVVVEGRFYLVTTDDERPASTG